MITEKQIEKTLGFGVGVRVNYRTAVIDHRPGKSRRKRWLRPWSHNLVLDSGLNQVASDYWTNLFTHAAAGTGTNPTERDSGAITITSTAGALVASANYFEAADVGRLLRLDTGEQGYITAYTDPQNATWNGVDAAAAQGTIYYVNRTALQTEVKRTSNYRTSSGDNASTWNSVNGEWTHQRTYLFSVEAGAVTYREVGWSWGTSPTALFGMDVLSGGGDSLVAGQQYLIVVQVVLRLSPTSSTTAPNIGTGGWNTEGDISLGDISTGNAFSGINSNGTSNLNQQALEPSQASTARGIALYTQAGYTLPVATNGSVTAPTGAVQSAGSWALVSYVTGAFTRRKRVTFGVSEVNGSSWIGCMIWQSNVSDPFLAVKFDAAQTKDNIHTITIGFDFTWNRRF